MASVVQEGRAQLQDLHDRIARAQDTYTQTQVTSAHAGHIAMRLSGNTDRHRIDSPSSLLGSDLILSHADGVWHVRPSVSV